MTYGTMATDRLEGINYARMRKYRLNRTKEIMEKYGIGTIVTWDAWDMRYISSAYATVPCRYLKVGSFLIKIAVPKYNLLAPYVIINICYP